MFCKKIFKLKVCFLTNLLLVKIKQVLRLNGQIKSDCLISSLAIILLNVKNEHVLSYVQYSFY